MERETVELDKTLVSVGFRVPKYLIEFVETFVDTSIGRHRSEVFRIFLEIL